MHAAALVELAALAASHGGALIDATREINAHAIQSYWSASKCRLDRWAGDIKAFQVRIQQLSAHRRASGWRDIEPVLEEIVCSEVLTRVWTNLLCALDRRCFPGELEPVARSVFVGHLEARRRALNLLVFGRTVGARSAERINRLRSRCERWSDMLLGLLVPHTAVRSFAFEARRPHEFAGDLNLRWTPYQPPLDLAIVLTAVRFALHAEDFAGGGNTDLNGQVASSVLACFPSSLFHQAGLPTSLWLERASTACDRQSSNLPADLFGPLWSLPELGQTANDPGSIRRI